MKTIFKSMIVTTVTSAVLFLPASSHMRVDSMGLSNVRPFQPVSALSSPSYQNVGTLQVITPKPTTPPQNSSSGGCGDNEYARYIYEHESGCSTTATNSQGCYGLGQDCNGIVRAKCGADYTCQNAYFTQYANSRYGGWAGAYNRWQQVHWW